MAKTYTISGGRLSAGIKLARAAVPTIEVGESGRGRKLVAVPLPASATVTDGVCTAIPVAGAGGETAAILLLCDHSGYRGSWRLRGARTEAEWDTMLGHEAEHGELAARLMAEHSPAWHDGGMQKYDAAMKAAGHENLGRDRGCAGCPKPAERPHGCRAIAEGARAQGAAGGMGGGPEYLLVVPEGTAIEVVRSGRLYGEPAVIQVRNVGGELVVSSPRTDSETRLAAGGFSL